MEVFVYYISPKALSKILSCKVKTDNETKRVVCSHLLLPAMALPETPVVWRPVLPIEMPTMMGMSWIMAATRHMWLLSTWNVASANEELDILFCFN